MIPGLISSVGSSISSIAGSLNDVISTATGFKMPSFAVASGANITNYTSVKVGGSNASASEIAGKTSGKVLQSTQKQS